MQSINSIKFEQILLKELSTVGQKIHQSDETKITDKQFHYLFSRFQNIKCTI